MNRSRRNTCRRLSIVLLTFLIAGSLVVYGSQSQGETSSSSDLPPIPTVKEPADELSVIRVAYNFVFANPDVAKYIPCFCNYCKMDSHHSVEECYIKSRNGDTQAIVWNPHAAECNVCISVVQQTRKMHSQGKDLQSIRKALERKFRPLFSFETDTPQVPRK